MNQLTYLWLPALRARDRADAIARLERAKAAAFAARPALSITNFLLSALVCVALLAFVLVLLPSELLANSFVRVPLIAFTPVLALALYSFLTARSVQPFLDTKSEP